MRVLLALLLLSSPALALENAWPGGGAGSSDLSEGALGLSPSNAANGIYVGSEAADADKDIQLPVGGPIYSELGYDSPMTLPTRRVLNFATGTGTWGGDTADRCIPVQDTSTSTGPTAISAGNQKTCFVKMIPANTIRLGRAACEILNSTTQLDANDTYTFKLWGCPQNANTGGFTNPLAEACTNLGTVVTIADGASEAVGADSAVTLSSSTIAAGTYAYLVLGSDGATAVDPANNTAISFVCSINVEN